MNLTKTPNLVKLTQKYAVPIIFFIVFNIIGIIMIFVKDYRYFFLFNGIGVSEFCTRTAIIHHPEWRQTCRKVTQLALAALLLGYLGGVCCVNFQYDEIFFDLEASLIRGALIQLVVARLLMPIFFGNAFCSRACWDGALFEITNKLVSTPAQPIHRNKWIAWGYLLLLTGISISIPFLFSNPAIDDDTRRIWIISENIIIISTGVILNMFCGSRSYCRLLCPFMTISSLLYKTSIFKITPVASSKCIGCNKCTKSCPMLIDVKKTVADKQKISTPTCILCEQCVSSCPKNVLRVSASKVDCDE